MNRTLRSLHLNSLLLGLLLLAGTAMAQTPFTQNDMAGTVGTDLKNYTPATGNALVPASGAYVITLKADPVSAGNPALAYQNAANQNNVYWIPGVAVPSQHFRLEMDVARPVADYAGNIGLVLTNSASFASSPFSGNGYLLRLGTYGGFYMNLFSYSSFTGDTSTLLATSSPAPTTTTVGQTGHLTLDFNAGVMTGTWQGPTGSPVTVTATNTNFVVNRVGIYARNNDTTERAFGLKNFKATDESVTSGVTSVTVSPSPVTVPAGTTQQFTAAVAVTDSSAQTVTWTASAGTITAAGLWTAPSALSLSQSVTITATSTVDGTKNGTATATVPAGNSQVFSFNGTVGSDTNSNTSVWGSSGGNSGGFGSFGASETQLRGTFTGTELEVYLANPSAPSTNFYASIDGGSTFNLPVGSTSASYLIVASRLTDAVHTYVVQSVYGGSFGYDPAFRVTGASPAMGKTPNPTGNPAVNNIVAHGDSRSFSQNASAPGNANSGTSYPADLKAALGANYLVRNQGIPGAPYSTGLANFANDVATQYGAAYKTNTILNFWGYNDIGGGQTTAQLEASAVQYVNKAHAAGFKVITGTIPDGTSSTNRFAAYNAWLLAGNSGSDKVSDIATLPQLAYPFSSTYWGSDFIHFTDAGYAAIEGRFYTDYLAFYASVKFRSLSFGSNRRGSRTSQ